MPANPKNTNRLLIVEDEVRLAQILHEYLAQSGFDCEQLHDGHDVVSRVQNDPPALVLLDLMLPGGDGIQICREIRQFSELPIIMLTARVEEIDRLLGLEIGADDYVCKPYSPREVVARVKAVLRRSAHIRCPTDSEQTGRVTGLNIDQSRILATLDGARLDLTRVEFRLLATLAHIPGRVLSRSQLVDAIYDDHRVVSDRTVDTHIKNLRRKLEAVRPGNPLITSVYGVGYRIET
ncbi:MAG: response regulator [Gammaproteobacteria bacterium]|nr:response regulator [Gammaproteobacteria bacterium]